jgi:hypothetical protein
MGGDGRRGGMRGRRGWGGQTHGKTESQSGGRLTYQVFFSTLYFLGVEIIIRRTVLCKPDGVFWSWRQMTKGASSMQRPMSWFPGVASSLRPFRGT